jgi:hypothetical protein
MDLAEAEHAAIAARPRSSFTSVALAGMGKPRDLVTEWEERVKAQFKALQKFAKGCGCSLKQKYLPPPMVAIKPGREIIAIDVQPRLLPGHEFDAVERGEPR